MNAFPVGFNGVGIPSQIDPYPMNTLETLGQPDFINWGGTYWPGRHGAENYWSMVYKSIPEGQVYRYRRAIAAAPDRAWFLLNEPNRPDQANLEPAEAIESIAKAIDVGIRRFAAPGVVISAHNEGYKWLNDYMSLRGPVGEAWHIHLYDNRTPADFIARFYTFRDWMRRNFAERPVIVTETNAGYLDDTTMQDNIDIMHGIAEFMEEEPLLQSVFWYASQHYQGNQEHASDLMRWGTITELGKAFRDLPR